jgi:hypothetical protein
MPPIDGKEEAGGADVLVQLLARDAGLDHDVEVGLVHRQHLVHAADVERDAAVRRADVAFQRRAGPERNDWRLVPGAELHDRLDLFRRLGEHNGVGQMGLVEGDVLAVLLAHGMRRAHSLAVVLLQLGDRGVDFGSPRLMNRGLNGGSH